MTDAKLPAKTPRALVLASALLPVLLLAGILYLLFARGTGLYLEAPAPIEKLEFERVVLEPGLIRVHVINTGPVPPPPPPGPPARPSGPPPTPPNTLISPQESGRAAEPPAPDRRMLGAFALL